MTSSRRRIAILSSATAGGAGLAAARFAHALAKDPDLSVDLIGAAELGGVMPAEVAPIANFSNRRLSDTLFTVEYPGHCRPEIIERLQGYDAINVHWSAYIIGLAELAELARRGLPLLFTAHDFYYLSGGCHYPAGCKGMTWGCDFCPQVDESRCDARFVPLTYRMKRALFAQERVHLAAPSQYLLSAAVASGQVPASRAHLLRNAYEPPNPLLPRQTGLRPAIVLIADTLAERRKGMALALAGLNRLADRVQAVAPGSMPELHVVGGVDPMMRALLARCRLPSHLHGRITDAGQLAGILQRADLLLTASSEDNWPNVLVEAGAQGCAPVVGPGHGCAEFVRQFGLGTIAEDYTPDAFAAALLDQIGMLAQTAHRSAAAQHIRQAHAPDRICTEFRAILSIMMPGW